MNNLGCTNAWILFHCLPVLGKIHNLFARTFRKVQLGCSENQIVCSSFAKVIEAMNKQRPWILDIGQCSDCPFLAVEHLPLLIAAVKGKLLTLQQLDVESTGCEVRLSALGQILFHRFVTLGRYLTSLCFAFLICKMGVTTVSTPSPVEN